MNIDDALQYVQDHLEGRFSFQEDWPALILLAAEVRRLREDNDRLRRDRAEALNVHTKEGLLASEWVARTGRAEAEVRRLRARLSAEQEAAKDNVTQLRDEVRRLHECPRDCTDGDEQRCPMGKYQPHSKHVRYFEPGCAECDKEDAGAEVRRLHTANVAFRVNAEMFSEALALAEAKLARVEALPDMWRASANKWSVLGCAGALDAAMKDKS